MKIKDCLIIILLSLFTLSGYTQETTIIVGAERTHEYLKLLKNKKVGIVANQTSLIENSHIVDSLLSLNVDIQKIYSPEHGFRGKADAGEHIKDGKDAKTGLPVISLYGSNRKPKKEQLEGIDILIFDLQDVGVRFYTYISTMHYVMEACAENNIDVIIFDRPNPNGFYVDGPILDTNYKSFVGMHPVPIVHGMTVGEYALMINGELWLKDSLKCNLKVVKCDNYTHRDKYTLKVKPSPNLPNMQSVYLYPSLCLFEGTVVSIGRGTDFPFQAYGHPDFKDKEFEFTPRSVPGASKNPKLKGELCRGTDLREYAITSELNLAWLIEAYNLSVDKDKFFNGFFKKLGGEILQKQIKEGLTEKQIKATWQEDIAEFKRMRLKYLLYNE